RMTFKVGSGSKVSISGGGEGTSNCTKDETVTSFTTMSSEEAHDFGFYAKTDGVCDILERSYSYFNVVVKESNDSTVGSAKVYFGQGAIGSVTYNISCSAETDRITCQKDRD